MRSCRTRAYQCLPSRAQWRLGLVLAVVFLFVCAFAAHAQQTNESVLHRQFGLSRVKTPEANSAGSGADASTPGSNARGQKSRVPPVSATPSAPITADAVSTDVPLALGYTILQETGQRGLALKRINKAAPVFNLGDKVRLLLETNADGYLYVFNTVDGQDPELLFPNPRLDHGENRIQAHVPCEIPSRDEPNPDARWFVFQPPAGTEQLYLVLSRTPLAQVPSGAPLVAQCRGQKVCAVKPVSAVWQLLTAAEKAPKQTATATGGAAVVGDAENTAIARRLRLPPSAPTPAVLQQNQTASAEQLVVVVNLVSR